MQHICAGRFQTSAEKAAVYGRVKDFPKREAALG